MSTTIATPSANNAKMRWMEPYVSDGLNAKLNGIIPAGVVRGGKLVTGGAGLLVTVQADPIFGDSIYSYIDSNGRQLTFKQVGDVTLDLDVGGVPGTTVYIGLEITYVVSAATLVYWRAYSEAEVDANPYLVVLGRVVVPALPGPIPAANVTPRKRRDAWLTTSPGMRDWVQLVINGSFDSAAAGQITSSDEDEPPLWDSKNITLAGLRYDIDQTNPRTGHNCLKLTGDGSNTAGSVLWNERYAAVRPGQMMRASMWVKGVGVSVGGLGPTGYLILRVNFVDKDYAPVSSWLACNAAAMDGNFDYTELTEVIEVPATAAWAYWGIYTWDQTNVMTGSYYVDDVRLWLEAGPPQEDDIRERLLVEGEPSLRGLDLAPWGTALSSYADGLAKTLRLRFDSIVTDIMQYEWKHRSGALAPPTSPYGWLLKLISGGIQIDRLIEGLGSALVGSDADAANARIKAPYRASGTGYTLMYEFTQQGAKGSIRIYATYQANPSGNYEAFVVTVNALWNASTNRWNRDQATRDSTRFDITSISMKLYWYDDALVDIWQDSEWASVGQETLFIQGGGTPFLKIPAAGSYAFDGSRDGNYITFTGGDGQPSTSLAAPIEPEWSRSVNNRAYPEVAASAALFFNLNMLKNGDVIEDLTLFTYFSSGTAFDWELHEIQYKDPAAAPTDIILSSGTTSAAPAGWKTDSWTSLGLSVTKGIADPNIKAYYLLVWSPLTLGSLNFVAGGLVRYETTKVYV